MTSFWSFYSALLAALAAAADRPGHHRTTPGPLDAIELLQTRSGVKRHSPSGQAKLRELPPLAEVASLDTDVRSDEQAAAVVLLHKDRSDVAANASDPHAMLNLSNELAARGNMSVNDMVHNNLLLTLAQLEPYMDGNGEDEGCGGDPDCSEGDVKVSDAGQRVKLRRLRSEDRRGGRRLGSLGNASFAGLLWPSGKVKYCFADDVPSEMVQLVHLAMDGIRRAVPCVEFTETQNPGKMLSTDSDSEKVCDTNDPSPQLFIQSQNSGCWSYIGYQTRTMLYMESKKTQRLNLGPHCLIYGTVIHELFHTLGMDHEHERPDRSDYVHVHWENVVAGKERNFELNSKGYTGSLAYDYMSVMHYGTKAFSKNREATLESVTGGWDDVMGQRQGTSQADAEQLALMYHTVNPQCAAAQLDDSKTGCVDKGSPDCSDCSDPTAKSACCSCGGGFTFRCWGDADCPGAPPDHSDCIADLTAQYSWCTHPACACVVKNTCSYTVEARCVEYPAKYMPFRVSDDAFSAQWLQICQDRSQCTFSKA